MSSTESSPPHGDGWRLRAYRDGDEQRIVRQFERVFRRPMTDETWRWKLKSRPSPVENVWLGVDEEDRPIFQYAAMPRKLQLPRGGVDVLVLVDLWTAPEYRRRRIFTTSARWIHGRWRRAGIAGILSPFNARDEPRYRRLGWQYLFPLRWQIRPLRPEAIIARRLGVAGLARWRWSGGLWNRLWNRGTTAAAGLEIRQFRHPRAGDDLPGRRPRLPLALEHDADWLRWRYLDCPIHRYSVLAARRGGRLVGHLVSRIDDGEGRRFAFVAELVGDDPEVESALIDHAIELLSKQGAVAVATLSPPGAARHRAWRRRGFLFSWGSFHVHWLPLCEELPLAQLRDPGLWEMAGGDYDVI